jgi:hypothetical protein
VVSDPNRLGLRHSWQSRCSRSSLPTLLYNARRNRDGTIMPNYPSWRNRPAIRFSAETRFSQL